MAGKVMHVSFIQIFDGSAKGMLFVAAVAIALKVQRP